MHCLNLKITYQCTNQCSFCFSSHFANERTSVTGRPVARMPWAAACYCLKPHDERIGWNPAVAGGDVLRHRALGGDVLPHGGMGGGRQDQGLLPREPRAELLHPQRQAEGAVHETVQEERVGADRREGPLFGVRRGGAREGGRRAAAPPGTRPAMLVECPDGSPRPGRRASQALKRDGTVGKASFPRPSGWTL